jgi:hypothetical protein
MRQLLQEWINENACGDEMLWKGAMGDQLMFIRDRLPGVLFASADEYREHCAVVISTHTSKSIKLPVVQYALPSGVAITMRDNFYDWKISISAPVDIEFSPMGLFDPNQGHHAVYFEGFPGDLIYGSYADNKRQFSVELGSKYRVYTLLWIMGDALGLRKSKETS